MTKDSLCGKDKHTKLTFQTLLNENIPLYTSFKWHRLFAARQKNALINFLFKTTPLLDGIIYEIKTIGHIVRIKIALPFLI